MSLFSKRQLQLLKVNPCSFAVQCRHYSTDATKICLAQKPLLGMLRRAHAAGAQAAGRPVQAAQPEAC